MSDNFHMWERDDTIVLATYPPRFRWTCRLCGKSTSRTGKEGEPPREGCPAVISKPFGLRGTKAVVTVLDELHGSSEGAGSCNPPLRSVERLRQASRLYDSQWMYEDGSVTEVYGYDPEIEGARNVGEAWRELADEIEREIAANYLEPPKDADGVPIRVGDLLESSEINKQFMCRGMSLALQSNEKRWTVEWSYDHYYGTSEYVSAKSCRHVKPDPLHDLLLQYRDRAFVGATDEYDITEEYCKRIRECLKEGGDD